MKSYVIQVELIDGFFEEYFCSTDEELEYIMNDLSGYEDIISIQKREIKE